MLRQATNNVRIEGILSEVDLDYKSYVKNGENMDAIAGIVKILVKQTIDGVDNINEIPIHVFANKKTTKGTLNPSYTSVEKVMNEFVSISAAGGEENADRVRITSGQIQMNEYYNRDGKLVSFPRVSASFFSKIKKDECKPEATFTVEMLVASQGYETDAEGVEVEPKRYKIKGIIPGWNNRIEVVDFVCSNENVINAISSYWQNNDTVKASGRLNFTSKTESYVTQEGFGEQIERTRTINVSDLVLTGGLPDPLEGEFAYDLGEIQQALTERKARLEANKEKDMLKNKPRTAPAPESSNAGLDLGF